MKVVVRRKFDVVDDDDEWCMEIPNKQRITWPTDLRGKRVQVWGRYVLAAEARQIAVARGCVWCLRLPMLWIRGRAFSHSPEVVGYHDENVGARWSGESASGKNADGQHSRQSHLV